MQYFLDKILQDKNINSQQLAKMLNISPSSLHSLRTGATKQMSTKTINKLMDLLQCSKQEVLFKSVINRNLCKICSDVALWHISAKQSEGLGVDIGYKTKEYQFCGAYYKKRSLNTYTLVDDWNMLQVEFWNKHFCEIHPLEFHDDLWQTVFLNEEDYIASVLYFGIRKAQSVSTINVVNYDIVFNDDRTLDFVKSVLPIKPGININLVLENLSDDLKYDNYVTIDKQDITFWDSLYSYSHTFWLKKIPVSDELWIGAFKANLKIVSMVKPNIDYACQKIINNDVDRLLNGIEIDENHKEEYLQEYLIKKVQNIEEGKSDNYDLDHYSEYQQVLRPLDSTISNDGLDGVTLGIYKKVLIELIPLIQSYYENTKQNLSMPIIY